ncbi:hypothetical protein BJX76DRAFT_342446 [Aspergillus varians]
MVPNPAATHLLLMVGPSLSQTTSLMEFYDLQYHSKQILPSTGRKERAKRILQRFLQENPPGSSQAPCLLSHQHCHVRLLLKKLSPTPLQSQCWGSVDDRREKSPLALAKTP